MSAVAFIDKDLLVSGSTNGLVKVWHRSANSSTTEESNSEAAFKNLNTIEYHSRPINFVAASPDAMYVYVASGDARVSVWSTTEILQAEQIIQPIFTVELEKGFFPLCIAVTELSPPFEEPVYLLAIGATSINIQVYISLKNQDPNYRKIATLKGHEDWVRSLAFKRFRESDDEDLLILASGSQDRYIRLWKILPLRKYENTQQSNFLMMEDPLFRNTMYKFTIKQTSSVSKVLENLNLDNYESSLLASTSSGHSASSSIAPSSHLNTGEYAIAFDALLMGHDDWIFSLQWHPAPNELRLLSASADSSLMIWSPDESSGIWVSDARLGDVSIKGASSATGSSGGFWTALWDPKEMPGWIATVGKSGSWRVWQAEGKGKYCRWTPKIAITGHVREVTGLAWAPSGDYLLTTSLDQTTRLLAPWKTGSEDTNEDWHEFARPQIHGYDMITVSALTSIVFVSAGDEKVLRVFEMPQSVAQLLQNLCQFNVLEQAGGDTADVLPDAANVPSLGLSNKAVSKTTAPGGEDDEGNEGDQGLTEISETSSFSSITELQTPPLESHLQRHTLFPEIEKLYGHGYEISSAAISHDGKILATTCRANSSLHAVIRLFDTTTWHEIRPPLEEAHTLTVTDLGFSADDRFLLSVGRDRMLAVWERQLPEDGSYQYKLRFSTPRGHTRIIWDCAWAPSELSSSSAYVFATASRDKSVKIWVTDCECTAWTTVSIQKFDDAVTAVDFWPATVSELGGLLAIGLDNGKIFVYAVSNEAGGWSVKKLVELDDSIAPACSISKLTWRPNKNSKNMVDEAYEIAVASEDSSVRIYSVKFGGKD